LKPGRRASDPAEKSPDLPAAKKYLVEVTKMPEPDVNGMPAARVLMLYLSECYHEYRDHVFKSAYLPFADTPAVVRAAEQKLKSVPEPEATEPIALARLLLPAIPKVKIAQVRLDRKTAMLRVVEALRIYAAAHDGKL